MFSDHWLAPTGHDPASRLHAWLDLCQMATHKTRQTRYATLERGQFVGAVRVLAKRWHWSKSAVQRFLDELILRDTIGTVCGTPIGTVYVVVKYDDYVGVTTDVGDSGESKGGTAAGHEQEGKKSKRKNTSTKGWKIVPPEWQPNEEHRATAVRLGLDLAYQERKFRAHRFKTTHHDAHDTFDTWLNRAAEWSGRPNGNANGNGHLKVVRNTYRPGFDS
jgi:hypothetical protein